MRHRTRVTASSRVYDVGEDLSTVVGRINSGRRSAAAFVTFTRATHGRVVAVRPFAVLDIKSVSHTPIDRALLAVDRRRREAAVKTVLRTLRNQREVLLRRLGSLLAVVDSHERISSIELTRLCREHQVDAYWVWDRWRLPYLVCERLAASFDAVVASECAKEDISSRTGGASSQASGLRSAQSAAGAGAQLVR